MRRVTREEWHALIRDGVIGEDDKLELIFGTIVSMTPQSEQHAYAISKLNKYLVQAAQDQFQVRVQLPLSLLDESEPEPDLALVREEDAASTEEHPTRAELVVEVGGDSLHHDRTVKSRLYARAGIAEYWIVDLQHRSLEVRRAPDSAAGTWGEQTVLGEDAATCSLAIPGAAIEVTSLFRAAR